MTSTQTSSGGGTIGQRYLFRPVFGSGEIRLSPPENSAGMKSPRSSSDGMGSGLRRQDPACAPDRSVCLSIHPAFLFRRRLY